MRVMRRSTSRKLSGAHTMVFWIGDAPRRHRGLPAGAQDAQRLDHPVPAFRRYGPYARESCMRRILSVEVVVLATPPPILPVGRGDLEHRDPGLLQEAQ